MIDIRANLLVDTISLSVALVVLVSELRQKQQEGYSKRFRALLASICLVLAMDLLAWLCDGATFDYARQLAIAANTGYYAMQITCCWLWARFVYDWAHRFRKPSTLVKWLFAIPLLVEFAALILNLFTECFFYINAANRYTRSSTYYIYNLIPFFLYTLLPFLLLIRCWLIEPDADRKRHCLVLFVGAVLPACGNLIEVRNYGMSFTWPLAALALLLIYISTLQEQNALDRAEAADAKAKLAESRMSIMLSQIQPHFLYNSLTVIAELCDTDPSKARDATMQFSAFLRGNMSSLTMNRPIDFEHELQHTKNYLALEQLRFSDRLKTDFQIETTQFRLPTLTLQPIVENAVRYGITKRPEGGTVTIRTQDTVNGFVITISDDGVGFDPMTPKDDGRTHIGLANVRDRLQSMVNGTLDICSTPNVGTIAVITIPKGELPC